MCMDLSMPALLGYFMTMIYNPNNVSIEASPITTVAEMTTGDELCRMFGFNIDSGRKDLPLAWGRKYSFAVIFYRAPVRSEIFCES